jgi:MFS family permease
MAFFLAIVTYLDRVCISVATPFIRQELGLSLVQMSTVFGAFTLAYSLFEVPSGWLGDVIGPRRVLTRIVLWWSAFTMLTGAAQGLRSLVAIRFLFGAGEAGAFPNVVRSFSQWFPARERGLANGVLFLGSRLGGAITAPIALLLIQRWGWRRASSSSGRWGSSGLSRGTGRFAIDPPSILRSIPRSSPGFSRMVRDWNHTSRRRGADCSPARTSTPSARCISPSATVSTSTSRGCRRI